MKEISKEARERFYDEVSRRLSKAGIEVLPEKDGLLPLAWDGDPLCRITAGGGVQYHAADLEPDGAEEAFRQAVEIAQSTAEYMQSMESAPPLRAQGLEGDYRLLADFGGAVLAGHPTNNGVEFVTWEWDFRHNGMWQGHYYGDNYAGAKRDFAVRSGLIRESMLFEQEELEDIYRCCTRVMELDDTMTYEQEQRILKMQEHIENIAPVTPDYSATMEQRHQEEQNI